MAHWIKPKPEGIVIYEFGGYVECSNCHKKVHFPDEYKFCPFCGQEIENMIIPKKFKYNYKNVIDWLPAE